jgi:hypothetical protein
MMNGVCCMFQQQEHEADERRVESIRRRAQDEYERKLIFEKEEWDLKQSLSAKQEERRRSLVLAKLGAQPSSLAYQRVISDDAITETRDNTTGYRQSVPPVSPSSTRLGRSPRWDLRRSSKAFPTEHASPGHSSATNSASWYGKEQWTTPPPMASTPVSVSSLIDLDEEDEQHEPEELELADRRSLVEISL